MDNNDRARGNAGGRGRRNRGGGGGGGNTIKGPHSALTDYLQEIGVSEHFRQRRRREAEARQQQEAQRTAEADGQTVEAAAEQSADAAMAADMQAEEEEQANVGSSSRAGQTTATETVTISLTEPVAAEMQTTKGKGKGKGKGKKRKAESDYDSDSSQDEAEYRQGLNRSSARKGGRMKDCEVCGKRFLQRGEHDESARLLCAMCRRSLDKSLSAQKAATKRAREIASAKPRAAATKQAKARAQKTAGGLLESEFGVPSLQDLCVRVIAKHLDQVDSFGDISGPSLNRLCRIISKMRVLDEQTMGLFLGADKSAVTLYDCTKITQTGMQRIVNECPAVEALDLEYCGRLNDDGLMGLAQGLGNLTSLRLDGAFLVTDSAWAQLLRLCGPRLTSFRVRFTGFGPAAMRALVVHCERLVELCVSECSDFNDECLAMLAAPLTEHEEEQQESERLIKQAMLREKKGKDTATNKPGKTLALAGPVPEWAPLAHLQVLLLAQPHCNMDSRTASRIVRAIGKQLRVLDLTGFRDLDDGFMLDALDGNSGNLQELYLGECTGISAEAMAEFFVRQQKQSPVAGRGYQRIGLGRCYMLTDAVIQALVRHSSGTLKWLNLNSVDDNLSAYGLLALAGDIYRRSSDDGSEEFVLEEQIPGCAVLEEIDLSWVRCTTDGVLQDVLQKCPRVGVVRVYGCPEVTTFAPRRPGLHYIGRECDSL
ncbi:UV-damaged DNA-binding protein rad7 [Coemansia sp. Benny D115]|nr:UV-damaged DNA-binding protein rad7 [Coemansia sp. Benny D115]